MQFPLRKVKAKLAFSSTYYTRGVYSDHFVLKTCNAIFSFAMGNFPYTRINLNVSLPFTEQNIWFYLYLFSFLFENCTLRFLCVNATVSC